MLDVFDVTDRMAENSTFGTRYTASAGLNGNEAAWFRQVFQESILRVTDLPPDRG